MCRGLRAPSGSWSTSWTWRRRAFSERALRPSVSPCQRDLAGDRRRETDERARERGLARARLADQGQDLAAPDHQVGAVEGPGDPAAAGRELDPHALGRQLGPGGLRPTAVTGPILTQAACRPSSYVASGRLGRQALVGGPGAARREGAALGQVARVGRVAGQPGRGEAGGRVADPRERRRQRAGVGVQRPGEDLARPARSRPRVRRTSR